MKKALFLTLSCITILPAFAQIQVNMNVNTSAERRAISPLIYGSNGQSDDHDENITARRLGGNRMTGYNWENNNSHAGADWFHSNDDYLPWNLNLPSNQYAVPNIVYKTFHDTSIVMNCYSLLTLPMAGYVSYDKNGTVSAAQAAPSARFKKVINQKGSAFSLFPDTTDGNVYVDECLNNLIQQYGNSGGGQGIRGYSMDNEYSLWNSTHPRIHPAQPSISEVVAKSKALAATIKGMDPGAEVFGPADYGYASFLNFQTAPDWSSYSAFGNFISAYLHQMKLGSDTAGMRLLDVVDVHWYPEARGRNDQGVLERVTGGSNDRDVAIARMQCVRSLWDSSYVENSWIGQWYSPVVYINALMDAITNRFPGTKLAFTEFDYGGGNHISGGIALADLLGVFGKKGVYMGNYWGALDQYVSTAYRIYRNYDGTRSTFGDLHVLATADDDSLCSVYAALESTDTSRLHILMINKAYDSTVTAHLQLNSSMNFGWCDSWYYDSNSTNIIQRARTRINGNQISYTMPPLSVHHLVLVPDTVVTAVDPGRRLRFGLHPNPAGQDIFINTPLSGFTYRIFTADGRMVLQGENEKQIHVAGLSAGLYFIRIQDEQTGDSGVSRFVKE